MDVHVLSKFIYTMGSSCIFSPCALNCCEMVRSLCDAARLSRGMRERIYLLDAQLNHTRDHWSFVVEGQSGNRYMVDLRTDTGCICSCPDFKARRKICKHIYFILVRIAKWDELDIGTIPSEFTLTEELTSYISNALSTRINILCNIGDADTFEYTREDEDEGEILDGDCTICFEELGSRKNVDKCGACSNYIHNECIERWYNTSPTCPLCRRNATFKSMLYVSERENNDELERFRSEVHIEIENSIPSSPSLYHV